MSKKKRGEDYMKEEDEILRKVGTGNAFKVPEGYFENLTSEVMDKLPEQKQPAFEVKEPTKWDKLKPLFYMAAMFAGIWLMMKMFTGIFSVEKGETPDMEMTASATDGSTIEDEWIAYYVDDYTAYEMLYTDSDY